MGKYGGNAYNVPLLRDNVSGWIELTSTDNKQWINMGEMQTMGRNGNILPLLPDNVAG